MTRIGSGIVQMLQNTDKEDLSEQDRQLVDILKIVLMSTMEKREHEVLRSLSLLKQTWYNR